MMNQNLLSRIAPALIVGMALTPAAWSREPGIAPMVPPGLTLGQPIALNPPPGFSITNRTDYASYSLRDNAGDLSGQDSHVTTDSVEAHWVPGSRVLGASYMAMVMVPLVHVEMTNANPHLGPLGTWRSSGMGNPKVQPVTLSWVLGDGLFAGTALGVYLPCGKYNQNAEINLGGNFWTFEPSVALTYLHDGWHASAHLLYNSNTRNNDNKYKSGDQEFFNLTLTKGFSGWDFGPVAYYQKQVTADSNLGGMPTFGGQTFQGPEQMGGGLVVSTNVGKVHVAGMVTRDFKAYNTMAGNKIWVNFTVPL